MKPFRINYAIIAAFLITSCITTALANEQEETPSYLGVRLMPVPKLLRVHLGLDEGVGQLIINIVTDSPADKAGLNHYDVIIAIDEQEVRNYDKFVEAIQSAGTGAKVSLTFISGGKKQSVKVQLEKAPTGQPDWKYRKTPLGEGRSGQPRQYEKRFFWSDPFEDDEPESNLPDRFRRFFKKEFRFFKDPNDGGMTLIPEEQNYRLDELERRIDELESRLEQVLEKLEELCKGR